MLILLLTSVMLITIDLRGNAILDGARSGFDYAFRPFEVAAEVVTKPVDRMWSGVTTVDDLRRENELLRDNGVFGSLEFHIPVWRKKDKSPVLTVAPFFDIGQGWNNVEYIGAPPADGIGRQNNTLASVGTGLIFRPSKHVNMQLYWGYALNRDFVLKDGKNLQDYGLHFSMSIIAF